MTGTPETEMRVRYWINVGPDESVVREAPLLNTFATFNPKIRQLSVERELTAQYKKQGKCLWCEGRLLTGSTNVHLSAREPFTVEVEGVGIVEFESCDCGPAPTLAVDSH